MLYPRVLAVVAAVTVGHSVAQPPTVADDQPTIVVERQVDAYNAHDVDEFASTYAPEAQIFNHPNELVVTGREAIRASYAEFFAQAPNVRAEILSMMTMASYVVAHERITGLPSSQAVEGIVIYLVERGLISRVWIMLEPSDGGPGA